MKKKKRKYATLQQFQYLLVLRVCIVVTELQKMSIIKNVAEVSTNSYKYIEEEKISIYIYIYILAGPAEIRGILEGGGGCK